MCRETDREVVENILLIAGDAMPVLRLSETTIETTDASSYKATIPMPSTMRIGLRQLARVDAHAPSRVQDIWVDSNEKGASLVIFIADESTQFCVTEVEVLRLRKRSRMF